MARPSVRTRLERLLCENLLPFWLPRLAPSEKGFRVNFDYRGRWEGDESARAVAQTRVLWFLSRLSRSTFGTAEHLRAARVGFRSLTYELWDPEFGGVFWERGRPDKHLYAQAFALYALSEYAVATGEQAAADLAATQFSLIRAARDPEGPGYLECLERDWTTRPAGSRGALGAPSMYKTANTHIHLLEAFAGYHRLRPGPEATEALLEMADLLGAWRGGDLRDRAFQPADQRLCIGHQLELLWLLAEAREQLAPGTLPRHVGDSQRRYAICRAGQDVHWGGFCQEPCRSRHWRPQPKVWWVQAEALLACLHLWLATGEDSYGEDLESTLAWIERRQIDRRYLGWHASSQQPRGDKGGPWKTPYHSGRALLQALEWLTQAT